MNHCTNCGKPVTTGRCIPSGSEQVCMLCKTARAMATFRYQSLATKRYWMKKGQNHGS